MTHETRELLAASLGSLLGDLTFTNIGEQCFESRFSSQYLCGTELSDVFYVTLTLEIASTAGASTKKEVTALLDTGATSNFITPELANALNC